MLTPAELQAGAIPFGCLYNARSAALYLLGRIAGVTDPETIALNSAGFNLPISNETAMLFLLAQMAGVTNLDEIISGSAGYSGLNERAAALYLAEVIATNGSSPSGNGRILTTPPGLENDFGITANNSITGLTAVSILGTNLGDGISITNQVDLESISFPDVLVLDLVNLFIQSDPALTAVTFPLLTTIGNASLSIQTNPLLTIFNLPSLLTVEGSANLNCSNNALITVALGTVIIDDQASLYFANNALSQASTDHILSRGVASAGFISGTVDLSGGTNAPPSSVAPGSDYDILVNRGVTVTVNP